MDAVAPNRTVGMARAEGDREARQRDALVSSTFYVDGILGKSVTGFSLRSYDNVRIGSNISSANDGYIDNLLVQTAAVPEPASIGLAAGLGGPDPASPPRLSGDENPFDVLIFSGPRFFSRPLCLPSVLCRGVARRGSSEMGKGPKNQKGAWKGDTDAPGAVSAATPSTVQSEPPPLGGLLVTIGSWRRDRCAGVGRLLRPAASFDFRQHRRTPTTFSRSRRSAAVSMRPRVAVGVHFRAPVQLAPADDADVPGGIVGVRLGSEARPYHVTNILLHALWRRAACVAAIARDDRLALAQAPCAASGLPSATRSASSPVAWISERKDVLSGVL
jgi:hypothetical protein